MTIKPKKSGKRWSLPSLALLKNIKFQQIFEVKSIFAKLLLAFIPLILLTIAVPTLVSIIDFSTNMRRQIVDYEETEEIRLKSEMKNQVDIAYEIILASYKNANDVKNIQKLYGARLVNIIEMSESIVNQKIGLWKSKKLTLYEAQREARIELSRLRYDSGTGYVWINNTTLPYPRMIMHPIEPNLNGRVLSDEKYNTALNTKVNLFKAAVELSTRDGDGFINYTWPKPGFKEPQKKLSYVRHIEEWNWVIGTGVYLDDVFSSEMNKVLEEIRELRYDGGQGYFWLIDTTEEEQPKILLEPLHPEFEGKVAEGDKFNKTLGTNENIVTKIVKECYENIETDITYLWSRSIIDGEQEKIAHAKRFKPMNWIVVSGKYKTEIINNIETKRNDLNSLVSGIAIKITVIAIILFFLSVIFTLFVSNSFSRPLKSIIVNSDKVVEGDLTVKFEYDKEDEIGKIFDSLANMVDHLKQLNLKIYTAVIILTKNLEPLFKSSNQVKDSANTQAVTVEQTHRNIENLNKMLETISNESAKANEYAEKAFTKAKEGIQSMKLLEGEMTKIENSSQEITDIIGMINEIAEQTNLLALNASIESARAGEAGKSFNIVSSEIRKLAEKSTRASNRIHDIITNNNNVIKEGVKYTHNTTNILNDISVSNEFITRLFKTVTEEIYKVKLSSSEILTAIDNISKIAQDNLKESESVSNSSNEFVEQAVELQKYVGQFDVRTDKVKKKQIHIEKLLAQKIIEAEDIIREYGDSFLITGREVKLGSHKITELQIGNHILTNNKEIVDNIAEKTDSSVTIFQLHEESLIRVATTVRNFNGLRAIGTSIEKSSNIYQTIIRGETYFGRAFVVNRWYVAIYKPILDRTGHITGVIYLGIPEDQDYLT